MGSEGVVVDLFAERGRRRRVSEEPRVRKTEIARRYNVSEKTVERYMKLGLPFEKPHARGAVRFVPSEVDRWWQDMSRAAAAEAAVV